jgi:hypothetical protein
MRTDAVDVAIECVAGFDGRSTLEPQSLQYVAIR